MVPDNKLYHKSKAGDEQKRKDDNQCGRRESGQIRQGGVGDVERRFNNEEMKERVR